MIHTKRKDSDTSPSLSVRSLDFHFYGKQLTAASHRMKGINALDAVNQLYNGISALRQQLPQTWESWRITRGRKKHLYYSWLCRSHRFFHPCSNAKKMCRSNRKSKNIATGRSISNRCKSKIHSISENGKSNELPRTKTYNDIVGRTRTIKVKE